MNQAGIRDQARSKKYVEVIATTSPEGVIMPLTIVWETGVRYHIQRVVEMRPARSTKAGGRGSRYTIQMGRHRTYLWYDGSRWFVEARPAHA